MPLFFLIYSVFSLGLYTRISTNIHLNVYYFECHYIPKQFLKFYIQDFLILFTKIRLVNNDESCCLYRLVCCLIVCFVIDYIVDWITICWFSPFSLTWDQPHILPTICYITLQNGKQKNEEINKQSEKGGGGRDWVDGLVETFASLSFPQRVSECRWFWLTSRDTNGWTQMCLPNSSTHPVTLYALFTALWAI